MLRVRRANEARAATLLAAAAGGGGGDCLKQAAPGAATLETPSRGSIYWA